MNPDRFKTPTAASSRAATSLRSTAPKRDSLAAELERDPQISTAKRQQRAQVFNSHMSQSVLERRLLAAEMAKKELEGKLREKDTKIDALENDRRLLAEGEAQEKGEKEQERLLHAEEKATAEREIRQLRASLASLRDEHTELRDEHASLSRQSAQTIGEQKAEISALRRQTSQLQQELDDARRLADERSAVVEDVQNQMHDLSVSHAESSRRESISGTLTVVQRELREFAEHNRGLEREGARMAAELAVLRERRANIEMLREEKLALEAKLKGMDELRAHVAKLEGELDATRRERQEWARKAAQAEKPSDTPVSVTQSLTQLRMQHARLLEDHGATVTLLRQREAELHDLHAAELELRAGAEESQQHARDAAETIARLEQTVALAQREVGFLHKYNDSLALEAAAHDVAIVDEAKDGHIKDLEDLLNDYKRHLDATFAELTELKSRPASDGASLSVRALHDELEKEREAARDALAALEQSKSTVGKHEETIENLEQTLFELRGEIGAGRHLPPGTRVLSLRDNPAQQWADLRQEAIDRLKGENEALLRRLKELEESGVRGGGEEEEHADLVPRESLEVAIREKADLEDTVKQKEKRLLRLQQVFTAKSTEFREAIAAIMGVKLAFYPNGQVRVTSQYDLNASFVFQPTARTAENVGAGARMQLIAQGEGGPQELPQLMRNWVEIEQCIPCFLASVTLECYDKWKAEGGGR